MDLYSEVQSQKVDREPNPMVISLGLMMPPLELLGDTRNLLLIDKGGCVVLTYEWTSVSSLGCLNQPSLYLLDSLLKEVCIHPCRVACFQFVSQWLMKAF